MEENLQKQLNPIVGWATWSFLLPKMDKCMKMFKIFFALAFRWEVNSVMLWLEFRPFFEQHSNLDNSLHRCLWLCAKLYVPYTIMGYNSFLNSILRDLKTSRYAASKSADLTDMRFLNGTKNFEQHSNLDNSLHRCLWLCAKLYVPYTIMG